MFERNELNIDSQFEDSLRQNVAKTFIWMAVGVAITGIISFICYNSFDFLYLLYMNQWMPFALLIAQLGIAVVFSARLFKMKVTSVRVLFLAYAALLGITLTTWVLAYGLSSVALAFGLSVGYFVALAVIGYTTKANLMRLGPILYTGLFVFIIAEAILMFLGTDIMTMGFAAIGLALFTGITAYDTQKMKKMYIEFEGDEDMIQRLSIYNAFQLYLDFINIFLYILRFVGNRD